MDNIHILIYLICLDYVTGVGAAIIEKNINSKIGRKGIIQKIGIFLCVLLCTLIDNSDLYEGTSIQPIAVLFFTINEILSILENFKKMNVPVPEALTHCFDKIKSKKTTKK